MAALLPIILVSSTLVSGVPKLDVDTSCKAAAANGVQRPQGACLQDEHQARATLEQQWKQYTAAERQRCTTLTSLGGPPSYVELLTCLETAKEAAKLPNDSGMKGPLER